ncbi:hypothetical protein V8F33_005528 [Rhypophila sp. PSN 637]
MGQERALTPPPYAPPDYAATGYDHGEEPSWKDGQSSLPKFALPAALLVGLGIAGGATYAVVAWVKSLQDNASIDGNMARWKAEAREKVYNACYLGCQNDCTDPNFAYDACAKTAQVKVKGINCDANGMWNWRGEDKYPDKCLEAVGRLLQGDELENVKNSYKSRLGLIALTIIAGIVAGVAVFFLWRRFTMSKQARAAAKVGRSSRERTWRPSTWRNRGEKNNTRSVPFSDEIGTQLRSRSPSPNPKFRARSRSRSRSRSSSPSIRGGGGNGRKGFQLLTSLLAVFGHSSTARAYACTREKAVDQYFTLSTTASRPAIGGVIHGWLADCKDKEDCKQSCHQSCKTVNGKRKCSNKCTKKCHTKTTTQRAPRSYVDDVAGKVKACGFKLVDGLPGRGNTEAKFRVANPRIERDLWVQIRVTGFNVTDPNKTDDAVWCLYGVPGK